MIFYFTLEGSNNCRSIQGTFFRSATRSIYSYSHLFSEEVPDNRQHTEYDLSKFRPLFHFKHPWKQRYL